MIEEERDDRESVMDRDEEVSYSSEKYQTGENFPDLIASCFQEFFGNQTLQVIGTSSCLKILTDRSDT